MPSSEAILEGLSAMAHGGLFVALLWHIAIVALVVAWLRGARPSRRQAALLAAAPLLSVSVFDAIYGSMFNTVVFGLATAAMLGFARQLPSEPLPRGARSATLAGGLMLALGWTYPHFLEDQSALLYLVAAPTGVVPCPTLSTLIGFALVFDGFGSRRLALSLGGIGLFYGLFGVFRLGVTLDILLTAGALALLSTQLLRSEPAPSAPQHA